MKLLSHIDLPDLRDAIAARGAAVEFQAITTEQAAPADFAADVLLTFATANSNIAEVLRTLPSLRWIHIFGTGIDNFPLDIIRPDQIVTIGRGASAVPIAEWVMAMLLSAVKQLPHSWISAPPAGWHAAQLQSLAGQTLAIAGYGSIGQALAKRAQAFDMRIRVLTRTHAAATNPHNTAAKMGNADAVLFARDWRDLVADADHVVLALPLTPTTRYMLDARALAALKPGSHLVNVARGGIVDQEALKAVLDSGQLALASLDTVTPEPLPAGHWLYTHPRVRLSAHISWSAPDTLAVMQQFFLDNVARFLRGDELLGRVNIKAGY
jgi:phosphoglycerate dehydrogenase-like enzyme